MGIWREVGGPRRLPGAAVLVVSGTIWLLGISGCRFDSNGVGPIAAPDAAADLTPVEDRGPAVEDSTVDGGEDALAEDTGPADLLGIDGEPEPDGSVPCPAGCTGGCADGRCHVDCGGDGGCSCPAGVDCLIDCETTTCEGNIDCGLAAKCEVNCDGDSNCGGNIECADAGQCTISCAGSSCGGNITCGAGPCYVDCDGESCGGDVICNGACVCEINCNTEDACGGEVQCPASCRATGGEKGCRSEPAATCDTCS